MLPGDERRLSLIAPRVGPSCRSLLEHVFLKFTTLIHSPAIAPGAFKRVLAMAGVTADTPATVLCDGEITAHVAAEGEPKLAFACIDAAAR